MKCFVPLGTGRLLRPVGLRIVEPVTWECVVHGSLFRGRLLSPDILKFV